MGPEPARRHCPPAPWKPSLVDSAFTYKEKARNFPPGMRSSRNAGPRREMKLRRANPADLPFILQLEREFCDLGFLGSDDARTHERQISDPDCHYSIVEENGERAGYVILRGLTSANRCVELKRIAIASPGRGLGRQVLAA